MPLVLLYMGKDVLTGKNIVVFTVVAVSLEALICYLYLSVLAENIKHHPSLLIISKSSGLLASCGCEWWWQIGPGHLVGAEWGDFTAGWITTGAHCWILRKDPLWPDGPHKRQFTVLAWFAPLSLQLGSAKLSNCTTGHVDFSKASTLTEHSRVSSATQARVNFVLLWETYPRDTLGEVAALWNVPVCEDLFIRRTFTHTKLESG